MLLLENKIADVTGGSSGIGLATARRFVEQGAYVFIAGHRPVEIDKAVAEIGHNVTGVEPTSPSSMTSTVFMRPSRGRARSTCFSRARPSSKRR